MSTMAERIFHTFIVMAAQVYRVGWTESCWRDTSDKACSPKKANIAAIYNSMSKERASSNTSKQVKIDQSRTRTYVQHGIETTAAQHSPLIKRISLAAMTWVRVLIRLVIRGVEAIEVRISPSLLDWTWRNLAITVMKLQHVIAFVPLAVGLSLGKIRRGKHHAAHSSSKRNQAPHNSRAVKQPSPEEIEKRNFGDFMVKQVSPRQADDMNFVGLHGASSCRTQHTALLCLYAPCRVSANEKFD